MGKRLRGRGNYLAVPRHVLYDLSKLGMETLADNRGLTYQETIGTVVLRGLLLVVTDPTLRKVIYEAQNKVDNIVGPIAGGSEQA